MRSWQPFEWIVALRFLREGRLQTAFIVGGVAIGVAVIVFMSELLMGLQDNFVRRVLTGQAHIQLLPPREAARVLATAPGEIGAPTVQPPLQRLRSVDQWPAVREQLLALPQVAVVAPTVSGSALVARGGASRSISVVGVEARDYFRIVALPDKIVRGEPRLGPGDLLIGIDLASDLGVVVGDKLVLTAGAVAQTTLTVAGIFDLGNRGANQRTTFVALHTAQSLMALPGGATSLEVTVRDVWAAETVAQRITALTGVEADSWIRNNAQFFTSINAQTTANTAIRFFVALSVAFGIASVLVVSVVQRSREIGILRAMGVTRGRILRVFLLQGSLLGLGGALAGCSLGGAALLLWQRLERNPDGTPLWMLELHPALFVSAMALASLTGLLAAFAPALRAARLDPVVAIRG
ncbi:ABC transporter permease [Roseateles cellulosilyticus]|uniref:ABC transporter permease n=1 Tax=Pelomonas cellulosilytica TaxID=2906762 RepID=A0ABS8Y041_9BURK|nr:FtsX-like permease family protein [Pelomonas sp. P8]MCE4556303.1 ABC transporter permease [Pelomonas sp. P8]